MHEPQDPDGVFILENRQQHPKEKGRACGAAKGQHSPGGTPVQMAGGISLPPHVPPRIAPQKPCEQQGLAAPWNAAEPAQGPQGMEGLAGQTAVQDHGADEEGKQGRNHRPQTER